MAKFVLDIDDIQKLVKIAPLTVEMHRSKGLVISLEEKGSLSLAQMLCEGNVNIKKTVFKYRAKFDVKGDDKGLIVDMS